MAKDKDRKCETRYCRSKTNGKAKKCPKCYKRIQKNNDPEAYTYNLLKNNALKRGKVFTISLEYFRDFCAKNNYIELKGRNKKDATIDRIKNELGYIEGNLRVISNEKNVNKRHNSDYKGVGTKAINFTVVNYDPPKDKFAAHRHLAPDDPNFIPF